MGATFVEVAAAPKVEQEAIVLFCPTRPHRKWMVVGVVVGERTLGAPRPRGGWRRVREPQIAHAREKAPGGTVRSGVRG